LKWRRLPHTCSASSEPFYWADGQGTETQKIEKRNIYKANNTDQTLCGRDIPLAKRKQEEEFMRKE
jgi:hypothetical protein